MLLHPRLHARFFASSIPPLSHFRAPGNLKLEQRDLLSLPPPGPVALGMAERILLSPEFYNQSQLIKMQKHEAMNACKRHALDTGSSEVQVSALSVRIRGLQDHCQEFKKDVSSRKGMFALMQRRRKLLLYMAREDPESYKRVIEKYQLREGQGSSRLTDRKESWSQPRPGQVLAYRPDHWTEFKKPPPTYLVRGYFQKKKKDLEQERKEERFRKEGKKVTKKH